MTPDKQQMSDLVARAAEEIQGQKPFAMSASVHDFSLVDLGDKVTNHSSMRVVLVSIEEYMCGQTDVPLEKMAEYATALAAKMNETTLGLVCIGIEKHKHTGDGHLRCTIHFK